MAECGRNEILNWINDTLQLNYTKIEQMCTGAAFCQLIDITHPGKIGLSRVNYQAKYDYEFIKNFSYLQESFAKIGIEKAVEVQELVKGKPQANLEFSQWMKKFFDQHFSGEPYDALERRMNLKILADSDRALMAAKGLKPSSGASAPRPSVAPTAKPATTTAVAKKPAATTTAVATKPASVAKPAATTTAVAKKPAATTAVKPVPAATTTSVAKKPAATASTAAKPSGLKTAPSAVASTSTKPMATKSSTSPTPDLSAMVTALKKQIEEKTQLIEEMNNDINHLKETIQEIETDRDFYFNSLRDVEVYCQNNEVENPILTSVLNILYGKTEENGGEGENQTEENGQEELVEGEEEILEQIVGEGEGEEEFLEQNGGEGENQEEEILEGGQEDEILEQSFNNDDQFLENEEI